MFKKNSRNEDRVKTRYKESKIESESESKEKCLLWPKYVGNIMTSGLISGSQTEAQQVYIFANASKFVHQRSQ